MPAVLTHGLSRGRRTAALVAMFLAMVVSSGVALVQAEKAEAYIKTVVTCQDVWLRDETLMGYAVLGQGTRFWMDRGIDSRGYVWGHTDANQYGYVLGSCITYVP